MGCHFLHQGSSQPRDQTCVSCLGRHIHYHCATLEALCKFRLYIWKFFVHILLVWAVSCWPVKMRGIEWSFEHSLALPFLEIGIKTHLFRGNNLIIYLSSFAFKCLRWGYTLRRMASFINHLNMRAKHRTFLCDRVWVCWYRYVSWHFPKQEESYAPLSCLRGFYFPKSRVQFSPLNLSKILHKP